MTRNTHNYFAHGGSELVIGGTLNNIEDQIDIIRDERFKKGDYYTDFMKHFQRPGQ